MASNYDAIVIGSGIGGLASALLLGNDGKKVALFEKHQRLGGRLGSFQKEGFNVDFGVHLVSRGAKSPAITLLERCGVETNIKFANIRPVQSTNGTPFKFPHDLKEKISDSDFKAIMKCVNEIKNMTDEQTHTLDAVSLESYLNCYTKDTFAHSCVSMIGFIYGCIPEYRLSAGEFARCLKWEASAKASGYPFGGCASIVNAYAHALECKGVEVFVNSEVTQIIVEDGKACGVIANAKQYCADTIISNADSKATVGKLVASGTFTDKYVKQVEDLEYSYASIIARFGLDSVISPDIKMLSIFSPMNPRAYDQMILKGEIPEEINTFVVVPSAFDPTIAPEGKQLIVMATAVPVALDPAYAPGVLEAMITSVESYFPHMKDQVIFADTLLPDDAELLFGESGAGIGIALQVGQVGDCRPCIKTPLEGLYMVGGEAGGSGVGIELCVNSAIEFYEKYGNSHGAGSMGKEVNGG